MPRRGVRGLNFHDPRGALIRAYPSRAARGRARRGAPADRRGRQAEGPGRAGRRDRAEFAALFFGAVYAGAWPVPLPLPTSFGGRDSYIEQLSVQLKQRRSDPPLLSGRARRAWPAPAAEAAASKGLDWEAATRDAPRPRSPRPSPTTSPICNIRAARPASRTASRHPSRPAQQSRRAQPSAWRWSKATAASRGCPGITTWGWSAASCRRSPTRSRPIISRPRISRAARSPGST
jgi:hypothetical protein